MNQQNKIKLKGHEVSIIRIEHSESNSTKISNGIINDITISANAKELLYFALSKPDNYYFTRNLFMKHFNYGDSKVARALKELKENGYLSISQIPSTKGEGYVTKYRFYEEKKAIDGFEGENGTKVFKNKNYPNGCFKMDSNTVTLLGPEAYKILCYCLSMPIDYNFRAKMFEEELNMTNYQVRQGTKELKEKGYMIISKYREDGSYETTYYIYERPELNKQFSQGRIDNEE